jgi:rhodanese-related sulfurtransferase
MEASSEERVGAKQAREAIATGEAQAIDIRAKEDWLEGHVPGALHAAGDQFEAQVGELSTDD